MKRLVGVLLALLALAAAPAAHAAHPAGLFSKTDHFATMDDGVGIASTLYVPFEHAPHPGVFPAVMLFHGLGGNRQSIDVIASAFARRGYIALTFDFRGHGQSGGLFTGLGARDMADIAILRERWLPANAPLDGDKVGAWGISLGGGAVLRATGEGTPFRALEVVETWTDLYDALVPQNLPKSGAIFQFLGAVPASRQAPELLALRDAVARRDVVTLRTFAQARSSRQLLARGYPPTLFFQGRRDFAFGLDQGIAAWQRLRTPKALYIGPFGHAPSRFPGPDLDMVLERSAQWFDVHLKMGASSSADSIELMSEDGTRRRSSRQLPQTATLAYRLRGRTTIGSEGKVVRRVSLGNRLRETFGAPMVRVRASSTSGWSHLVAVLVARTRGGEQIVVSEGGTPTRLARRPRTITIRLIAQVTKIPARSRLELTLAGTSTAQSPANLLYLVPVPQRARITIGDVQLAVPVLRTPISR